MLTGLLNKLIRIVQIEKRRYSKKGIIDTVIGFTLLLGLMWVGLTCGKKWWPYQIENKQLFIFVGSILCYYGFQTLGFLLYLPGYLGWSKYYDNHLINKRSTRPWERKNWSQVKLKTVKNLIINQLVLTPIAIYVTNKNKISIGADDFPTFTEIFIQIQIMYLVEDFTGYWSHRLFHTYPFLYKMHKVHHEYDTLYTFVNEYFHPVESFFMSIFPAIMSFVVSGNVHCFTLFYWMFWKNLITTENHSGYQFEWSPTRVLPLIAGPSHHDHHHSSNIGNYAGSCYLWDMLLDTNVHYMNQFLKN